MNYKNLLLVVLLGLSIGACQESTQTSESTTSESTQTSDSETSNSVTSESTTSDSETNLGAVEQQENTLKLTAIQLKNAQLSFGEIKEQTISELLKLNGKIEVPPQRMISVSAPLGGYLKSTKLLPGMQIKKGEVIAVLEDPQYIQIQQDYLQAQANLKVLNLDYERQKSLAQNMASSQKAFEQITAQRESAQIELSALAQKLSLIGKNPKAIQVNSISKSVQIYAPMDAVVTAVHVNVGKYVSAVDVLFELVDPSAIYLALNVYEKDLGNVFQGQLVEAYTNAQPENKHTAKVFLLGKSLNSNRSTVVHSRFDKFDKRLIPGTYMNAEIKVQAKSAFVIPEEAVVRYENKTYVFVKKSEQSFEMQEVKVGMYEPNFIEILNGDTFKAKQIVVKGAYTLLMALKNVSDED